MPRDSAAYLGDILDAIEKISEFTKGIDFEEFSNDKMILDAVTWNLEVIGEATKRISPHVKKRASRSGMGEDRWPQGHTRARLLRHR
jgi:uncharacterized protein with HEPN domain